MKWYRYFKTSNVARGAENKGTHGHFERRGGLAATRLFLRIPRFPLFPWEPSGIGGGGVPHASARSSLAMRCKNRSPRSAFDHSGLPQSASETL